MICRSKARARAGAAGRVHANACDLPPVGRKIRALIIGGVGVRAVGGCRKPFAFSNDLAAFDFGLGRGTNA